MTIFRILRHILELLARKVYLITGNVHFLSVIIHLGITELLLRCKKPIVLLFLHCTHLLKKALCYHTSYHSKYNFKKEDKLNLKSLTTNSTKKSTPSHFQRLMNTLVYFFTGSVSLEAGGMGESDDEGSDSREEPKHDVNEEKMEVTSDHSESEKTTEDAIGMTLHTTEEPLDSTSIPQTQQKRKAESEEEKHGKRSKSIDLLSETDNCQNELRDLMREIIKVSDAPEEPCRSTSLENKLQEESVSIGESHLEKVCDVSTKDKYILDVGRQSTSKARKTLTHSKIRNVIPVSSSGSGTENTSLKDSGSETFKCSGKLREPCPSSTHDIDYRLQGVLSSRLAPNYDITSSEISGNLPILSRAKLAVKSYAHKKCLTSFDNYQKRKDDACQSKSQDTMYEPVKHFGKPANTRDMLQHCNTAPNSGATEENSRKAKKGFPAKRHYRSASLPFLSPVNTHEPTTSSDSGIKGRHHLGLLKITSYGSIPQNTAEVASRELPTSTDISRSRRIAEAAKQYFQNFERGNQEVASIEEGGENREEFDASSTFSGYWERVNKDTAERTARSEESSDTVEYYYDRPSTSAETEYNSKAECEKDRVEGKLEMRTYPGLALRPLEVKKDALYQKKFYKQKKQIDLPVKLGESIQWAIKNSEYPSSDVPHPKADDSDDDKLSLEQYHIQAQTEVRKLMTNYEDGKEREKIIQAERDKKREERKERREQREKKLQNTGYAESSFIEESPPSDTSDGASSVILLGSSTKPPRASPDSLSLFGVSPDKAVARVMSRVNLESQPEVINIYSPTEVKPPWLPAVPDCVIDLRDPLPFEYMVIRLIAEGKVPNSSRDIFCRDETYNRPAEHESRDIPLKAFFRIKSVPPRSSEATSIEEFLHSLLTSQLLYYQYAFESWELFNDTDLLMNVCKIPLRHNVSHDESHVHEIPTYELDGDTLRPITSSTRAEHTFSLDSNWALSISLQNQQTRSQTADYKQQFLQIDVDEPSTSQLDASMNVCDTGRGEIGASEVEYVSERSPVRVLFQEKEFTPSLMTVESEEETDQQSEESESMLETSMITHTTKSCTKHRSEIRSKSKDSDILLRKFLDSTSQEETSRRDFADTSVEEQCVIMQSFSTKKQESDDQKDQANTVSSMEHEEILEEIDYFYNSPTYSEGESFDESCANSETAETEIKKEPLDTTKIVLKEESSFKPTINVELNIENTLPVPRLTQFPTVINIRDKNTSETEYKEFCSPSSEKKIINIEENPSSCASRTFSTSEKENLSLNKVHQSSQDFFSFGNEDVDASAKPSTEDESENTKNISISSEVANLDESPPHSQLNIQDTSEEAEINQGSQILSAGKSSSESSTSDKIP